RSTAEGRLLWRPVGQDRAVLPSSSPSVAPVSDALLSVASALPVPASDDVASVVVALPVARSATDVDSGAEAGAPSSTPSCSTTSPAAGSVPTRSVVDGK